MDDILRFTRYWDAKLDDIVWEEKKRLISKYRKFLNYDLFHYRKMIKEIIHES